MNPCPDWLGCVVFRARVYRFLTGIKPKKTDDIHSHSQHTRSSLTMHFIYDVLYKGDFTFQPLLLIGWLIEEFWKGKQVLFFKKKTNRSCKNAFVHSRYNCCNSIYDGNLPLGKCLQGVGSRRRKPLSNAAVKTILSLQNKDYMLDGLIIFFNILKSFSCFYGLQFLKFKFNESLKRKESFKCSVF